MARRGFESPRYGLAMRCQPERIRPLECNSGTTNALQLFDRLLVGDGTSTICEQCIALAAVRIAEACRQ